MSRVERRRIVVRGTVQGVGFRPWAVRQATRLGLAGHVGNAGPDLIVEIEGTADRLDAFVNTIRLSPPPLALVGEVEVAGIGPLGVAGFDVCPSEPGLSTAAVAVPADVATCDACLAEVDDPADRRHRYPFTNCTDCGPRYTIIRALPYDRATTTVADFALCVDCRREYEDPGDRRFHAEPIACGACGPSLKWEAEGASAVKEEALAAAVACVVAGGIVAMKGIGGYHLIVRADDAAAVGRLRQRKKRDEKPFAVMVATAEVASTLVELSAAARAELTSPRRPIVLARRRPVVNATLASGIAPGSPDLGILLPYSPLHHLMMAAVGAPLVMTSGNRTDEPIAQSADAATRQLADIADGFLHHDRPIHVRCDDSVVRASGGRVQVVRRSRGYAPSPIRLPPMPGTGLASVLAVGAELKSTVSIASGGAVVASHHLGDLEHPAAYEAFEAAVAHLLSLTRVDPDVVAHDLHPEYLSTKWAMAADRPLVGVQHHHAHVASCLVDHGRADPVVGIAFDGLGFGHDATLWGGEILLADLRSAQRLAHLRPVALPGGAAAIREPWRMALTWAALAVGPEAAAVLGPDLDDRWEQVLALAAAPSTFRTTSGGRLFDAIAALAGGRRTISYEGQAAAELETAAVLYLDSAEATDPDVADAWVGTPGAEPWVLDPSPMIADALARRLARRSMGEISATFHRALAGGLVRASVLLAKRAGVGTVALTGGVFQNMLLTDLVAEGVTRAGLEVLVHRNVPPNDGGISIGQAAVASACQ